MRCFNFDKTDEHHMKKQNCSFANTLKHPGVLLFITSQFLILFLLGCDSNHIDGYDVSSTFRRPTNAVAEQTQDKFKVDKEFGDLIGWREIIGEVKENIGIAIATFSLTNRKDDTNMHRTVMYCIDDLRSGKLDHFQGRTNETLVRIMKRNVNIAEGVIYPVYYVTRKNGPANVMNDKKIPAPTPEFVLRDRLEHPEKNATNEITPSASSGTSKPVARRDILDDQSNERKVASSDLRSAQKKSDPKTPAITLQPEAAVAQRPAVENPPITGDLSASRVVFSTKLTDYSFQQKNIWGVRQDRRGTLIYYDPRKVGTALASLSDPYTVRITLKDPVSQELKTVHLLLKAKVDKVRVTQASEDSIKIGAAILREISKNERIKPPMLYIMHSGIKQESVNQNHTSQGNRIQPLFGSPRGLSQNHVLMKKFAA